MDENPEYLRNRSRRVHELHQRNRRRLNWWVVLLCAFGSGLATASTLDMVFEFSWGFGWEDFWSGLAFVAFGGFFWLFGRLILSIVLGASRRLYGPDPGDAPE